MEEQLQTRLPIYVLMVITSTLGTTFPTQDPTSSYLGPQTMALLSSSPSFTPSAPSKTSNSRRGSSPTLLTTLQLSCC